MRYWIPLLLIAIALAGGVYYRHDVAERSTAGKHKDSPPIPVTVATVTIQDAPQLLEAVGRGTAFETVTLKSRVDGQVAEVPFGEGQHVRRDDVLIRLDPADFEARLEQTRANLARDEAQLAKARADVERYQALRQSGFVSEEKVGEVRANLQAGEAAVRASKAAVDLAHLQLGYTILRAPISGVVGAKLVFPGAAVKTNDTELVVINRVRPLQVSFSLPERYLPQLRAAMHEGRLSAAIHTEAGYKATGKITFMDNAVDTATGTIQLKALVANDEEVLAPGQFVQVQIGIGIWKGVATLPAEAVQQGPDGAFVFVVKPDQGIEQRKVELIERRQDLAVVASGLADGETVVTDGHLRLTAKSKVQVKSPAKIGAQ